MEITNPDRFARLTGFIYGPLMLVLGPIGIIYVPTALVVAGDPAATAQNILSHLTVFRLTIVVALLVQVTHIFIVLMLFQILKPAGRHLATLMVIFMLVSIPIAMANELNHVAVDYLLSGGNSLASYSTAQLQSLAMLFHQLHEAVVGGIAAIFWGLWLLPMGLLVIRSGFISKIPGVLLIIAGIAYLVDSVSRLLWPEYGTSMLFGIVNAALFGEIVFPFWLLIRGIDVDVWRQRAAGTA